MEKPLPVPPFQFPSSAIPRRALGYDRDATDNVFGSLAASYEQLWVERANLLERVAELEAELEQMRAEEPLLRDVLVEAHRSARAIVEEAHREAEAIVAQAHEEAEQAAESRLSELADERLHAEEEVEAIRRVARTTESELSSFLRAAIERARSNGDPFVSPDADFSDGDGAEARSAQA